MILKDDLQGSYIPIEAHGYLKGVCQEILPMGFTSLLSAVYKYSHILICFYRKRKRSKNILFINLLCLLASWYSPVLWEILQTPLGRPPMYFIQNWGHMGLFCCGEKSQIDQLVYFAFSFDRNQMAIIHCLSVQKVQVILILGQKYREPFLDVIAFLVSNCLSYL